MTDCAGEFALRHLEQLRKEGRSAGSTAILLGGRDDVNGLADNEELVTNSIQDRLRLAAEVNVEQWLKKRLDDNPECYLTEFGDWPSDIPQAGGISAHLDVLSKKPEPVVFLARIPTSNN